MTRKCRSPPMRTKTRTKAVSDSDIAACGFAAREAASEIRSPSRTWQKIPFEPAATVNYSWSGHSVPVGPTGEVPERTRPAVRQVGVGCSGGRQHANHDSPQG